jgi:hypothetical protein
MRDAVRARLAASPATLLPAWAIVMSFTTYFCMYAFRKPFSAATYEGGEALGIDIKTVFVISQIIGYCLSKYIGTKLCAEVPRNRRLLFLLGAITFAEFALFLFAILPPQLKIAAIFLNGLPLGMVWGFVVAYLEGRRTSELQLAGLSCSYIIASGVVKDVGRWQMDSLGIAEYWMPFTTGLMFFPILFVSATLLNWMPEPNEGDIDERVLRKPMKGKERLAFALRFAVGLSLLLVVYFALTAFRDIRDTYGVEIFTELGYGESPAIFTRSELLVAFGVMACLVPITWIHNNRKALMVVFGLLVMGCALIGVSTFAMQRGYISGLTWMILIGFGAYAAYVPYGSVLFDRVVAATRTAGTAVFAIYLTDAFGYTGSVAFQLYKVVAQPEISWLQFFTGFCYLMAIGGGVLLAIAYFDFARVAKRAEVEEQQRLASLQTAEEMGTA